MMIYAWWWCHGFDELQVECLWYVEESLVVRREAKCVDGILSIELVLQVRLNSLYILSWLAFVTNTVITSNLHGYLHYMLCNTRPRHGNHYISNFRYSPLKLGKFSFSNIVDWANDDVQIITNPKHNHQEQNASRTINFRQDSKN